MAVLIQRSAATQAPVLPLPLCACIERKFHLWARLVGRVMSREGKPASSESSTAARVGTLSIIVGTILVGGIAAPAAFYSPVGGQLMEPPPLDVVPTALSSMRNASSGTPLPFAAPISSQPTANCGSFHYEKCLAIPWRNTHLAALSGLH
jgi:hypothetical protein